MEVNRHGPDFATTGQLEPAQLAEVAAMGFRAVIDNRPDDEGGEQQPASTALAEAAREHGLEFVYQPVVSGQIDEADVKEFAAHLARLPTPVLAFCRTGARSASLYARATGG